jgi:trehalose utilization protein
VIHDEAYGGFNVLPDVHPLLSTTHEENGNILAWSHTYKNSRIVYLQLGHDHFAYEDENYRQLLKQAIDWVNKK